MTKKSSPPKHKTVSANKNSRSQRGEVDGTVIFPTAPPKAELPNSYASWFADLKSNIAKTRLKVILNANSDLVLLYWSIGSRILEKQQTEGWGARIIDRLAHDLREVFPDMKGCNAPV